MSKAKYQYGTSPRKLEPEYKRARKYEKKKLKIVEDIPRDNIAISKEQKNRQIKLTLVVIGIFILLLTISYRNSQINEKFSNIQTLKKELSSIEKENEQLKVSIENSLNYNNIERQAKEKLGMQKLTNKQTVYIALPKKDYVETATEDIAIKDDEEESSWLKEIIDNILNVFK